MTLRLRAGYALELLAFAWVWERCLELASRTSGALARAPSGPHFLAFAAALALLVAAAVFLMLLLRGERPADLGLRRPARPLRAILLGLLAGIAIFFLLKPVGWVLHGAGLRFAPPAFGLDSPLALACHLLAAPLAGGLAEELAFRGYILSRLERLLEVRGRHNLTTALAVIASSAWFGLRHMDQGPLGAIHVGLYGAAFAVVYLVANRNLWPAIAAHTAVDVASFLELAA